MGANSRARLPAMTVLPLPRRPANDDNPETCWYCRACDCAAFMLVELDGVTTIECVSCRTDVTAIIAPTLSVGIDLCQR